MSESEEIKPDPIYKFLIMFLPVGVVLGTIIFMVMYFHMEREKENIQPIIVSREMKVTELEGLVEKFTDRIGERDLDTEKGRAGLRRAASMIEGGLGPQNLGLTVTKGKGEAAHGLLWKSLSVEIRGGSNPEEIVLAAVSYSGAGDVADANTVSTMIMLVNSMAREESSKTIRFVFLPLKEANVDYLKQRALLSLKSDEKLAGFIALDTMANMPELLDEGWVNLSTKASINLSNQNDLILTHSVYSADTWKDDQDGRLASTLKVAKELRSWLLKMAN